jgi:stalled ribosome rescue protein Dom34
MKQHQQKQKAGVWLDNTKAVIITHTLEDEKGSYSISSKITANEGHSGGSEHSMNNARKTDLLKYFKSLSSHLLAYEELLVFGPGMSQEQFGNHLEGNVQFKGKKITINSTEQLTDPQKVAKVRDFFEVHQS